MTYIPNHTRFFPDLLEAVVNDMDISIEVTNVTDNMDGSYTLTVCDVKYLQEKYVVTIDGENYTIDSINHDDKEVTVLGSVEPPVGSFNAPSVKYYHGTVQQTKSELDREMDVSNKTPMIYLLESFREQFNRDKDLSKERSVNARLFFLTQANFDDWVTNDYYAMALRPMRNLLDLFILTLDNDTNFDKLWNYETITRTRFGLEQTEKGYLANYFGENLCGIEVIFDFDIKRDNACVCDC